MMIKKKNINIIHKSIIRYLCYVYYYYKMMILADRLDKEEDGETGSVNRCLVDLLYAYYYFC